ncbi:MAG: choice-of-anchor B family protein, partial [Planctomycetes bacterium]|nr:choice-of-anchor B family protein [Planctomycetota bacterium]
MLSHVPLSAFAGTTGGANDVWGYVSPNGREYAILGLERGTGFVDITGPQNPVVVATIQDLHSTWSDMAVYDEYAYNVNEEGGGLQVISLEQIDNKLISSDTFSPLGLATAHNIFVNTDSGFAYIVGSNLANGGIVVADLSNPALPEIVGCWSDAYVHDIQVVSYTEGPLAGREIAFAFAGASGLAIVDVTDKDDMQTVKTLLYPTLEYCHQGWLSEDRRFLYLGDELDEFRGTVNLTTTYVIRVDDIENPVLLRTFGNGLSAIDHNLMVRGHYIYEANYTTGLRIFFAPNVVNIHEVGFFDTFPTSDDTTFEGAWGVYTGLPSGVILVSDRASGLFVLLADCNDNDLDDGQELRSGTGKDCNLNGILDACDITEGTAEDCNGNGSLDACDITEGTAEDCNLNGRPDSCDIAEGTVEDCNGNGVVDECDISDDFAASSGELSPIGITDPQSFTIESPPFAAFEVVLSFIAFANLRGGELESIVVDLNGVELGSIYTGELERCPAEPDEDQLIIPAPLFNEIVAGGDAVINMWPTIWVDSVLSGCDPTYIIVDVSYTPVGATLDCNLTSRPDECEFGDFDGN